MKNFFLLACILGFGSANAQYFLTQANHPLPEIDSFIVRYGIHENLLVPYRFEHSVSSEATPLKTDRYSQKHKVSIALPSFISFANDTVQVKVCVVKVQDAHWVSLLLRDFHLSEKAKLYFYGRDHMAFAGLIQSNANNKAELLPTALINTDEIIVVLIEPTGSMDEAKSRFTIGEVWSGSKKQDVFLSKTNAQLLNNSPNIACYFPEWRYESDAVARMELPDGLCSCTLMNNDNNDRTPYVMTSRHCLTNSSFDPFNISQGEINALNQTNFRFLFRHRDCGGNIEEQVFVETGATYLDSYFWTDHLLIRLNNLNLPPFLNYVGWDRTTQPNGSSFYATGISHPGVERQKYTFGTAFRPGVDDYKYGTSWTVGSTEQGSSGSALFNTNHKFVGQLAYGFIFDNYGRFSEVWETPYGGARAWLSPFQNLNSINPLIPMVMYGPTQLCDGSQGTVTMPRLLANEAANWTVTPNLLIVSATNNSVVITPNGASASGRGTVTATIMGQSTTIDLSVGIPDQGNIVVTNNTTGSSNTNPLPFCYYQSNNLAVQAINPALGGNEAIDAQWIFRNDWSPNTTTGTQVQTTPYNLNGNTPFSVKVKNACGWQNYPTGFGAILNQCGGYYRYQVYPNPAKDVLTVEFEKTDEQKSFPELFELFQQDVKGVASSRAVRSWSTKDAQTLQQLQVSKNLAFRVDDLPRGTYILHITKQNEKESVNKLDIIRIILE